MLILNLCDKVIELTQELTGRKKKMYSVFRFQSSFPPSRKGVREQSRWIQLDKAGQEVEEGGYRNLAGLFFYSFSIFLGSEPIG